MHPSLPLATIVIGNYNYARYVGAAIESALQQTYSPVEVIVVDDGSTDDSRKIIADYGARVKVVLQENAGQGATYNAGWRAARGEFVIFLDSDDVLLPDAIAEIAAAFASSDAVKVQYYLQQVDRDMKSLGYLLPSYEFSKQQPRQQIANYGYYVCPPASGNAYRTSFLNDIFPIADCELYRRAADGYTTGLAGMVGRIATIPRVLGCYRVHGENGGGESGVKNLQHLHHMFTRDIKRERSQHAYADRAGFHFKADRSRYCPGHTKLRLLSLRLRPESHPVEGDSVMSLACCGLVSAVTFPHLKPLHRCTVALGFIALALMPGFVLKRHFASITSAQKRHKNDGADLAYSEAMPPSR